MTYAFPGGDGHFTRVFTKDPSGGINVSHSYLQFPRQLQGGGAMKDLFKCFYKQYKNIGVTNVTVHANIDVGGYTWAQTGFRVSINTAKNFINRMEGYIGTSRSINTKDYSQRYTITQQDVDIAKERINRFEAAYGSSEEVPLKFISDISDGLAGKALFLGSDWQGHLDLRKDDHRLLFENYIYNQTVR